MRWSRHRVTSASSGEPNLAKGNIADVMLHFRNPLTGQILDATQVAPLAALPETRVHEPSTIAKRARAQKRGPDGDQFLSGTVHLTEDLLIDEFRGFRIFAGTTIKLDPDVSIECR